MVDYEILNLTNKERWEEYITLLPSELRDIYFTPGYYHLYEDLNEGTAQCFVFRKDDNIAVYPFLTNTVNSLGYDLDKIYYDVQGCYGYNGVLSSSVVDDFLEAFNSSFALFCQENKIIAEFSRFHPVLKNEIFSDRFITVIKDRETVAVDLRKDYSEIWESEYSPKNRNKIRKAQKNGYQIKVMRNPTTKDITNFIDIYYHSMKTVSADSYYFFSREYFFHIFKYLHENAFLFNVLDPEYGVVCTSIFFQYGQYFHYHLSGRSSRADNSVNNYLLDQAVIFGKKNGAKTFHLGGGRSTDKDDSLMKFKKNFSRQTLPFFIGKKIHNQKIYDEVVRQWEERYPEKGNIFKNYLLKYRFQ